MDTSGAPLAGEDFRASSVSVHYHEGRTAVTVDGTDLQPSDTEGWQGAAERLRQRAAGAASGESVPAPAAPKVSNAQFAKRVSARISRAARMPRTLPREEIKIVLRPRGGLNVGRTDASRLMAAIFAAAGTSLQESKEDTMCTNVAQNIIVISTPHEGRASKYAGIRLLRVGDRDHEVNAYLSAPNGTAKGVIRGISLSDSNRELQDNIVNDANPLALDAHRIGNTTTVIVVFEGTKVPNYVKY